MHLRTLLYLLTSICALLFSGAAAAQEITPVEIAVGSSVLSGNRFGSVTDAGVGGRFTYNLNNSLSLESEIDEYLTNTDGLKSLQFGGRATLAVAGIKAGIRRRKAGIFFKARPGVLSFNEALVSGTVFGEPGFKRLTHAVLDVGAAAEYYPAKRIVLRADVGPLLVRYGDATIAVFPTPNGPASISTTGRIDVPWHFAFSAAYRFGRLRNESAAITPPSRFTIGAHYSLLTLERSITTVRDESGIGGWLSWDFSRYIGLDTSVNVFPRKVAFFDFQQGGRIAQTFAGIRSGIRTGRMGIFAKVKPGLQFYTGTIQNLQRPSASTFADLALDIGGTIEVHTSNRTLLRFDAGNTTIYYRARDIVNFDGTAIHVNSFRKGAIQLTSGFGFNF